MRGLWLALALATAVAITAPAPASASLGSAGTTISAVASADLQDAQPPKDINIDINVNHGGRWYRSPVWIAIGAIAVVVVLMLLVMAARSGGGGTTIVKD